MSKFRIIKSLVSDSLIYGLSGLITSFIGIFLIPIYTRVFQPADYGVLSLLATTNAIIFLLLTFNLDNAAAVWYWQKTDVEERRKTFSCWFWFLIAGSLMIGMIIILFSEFWSSVILKTNNYASLIKLFGFTVMFSSFQKVVNIWFRMRRQPFQAVGFALFVSLVTIGLNILFVVYLHWGLNGAYIAQGSSAFLGFVACVILLGHSIKFRFFDVSRLKEMLVFSLPLLPSSLMYWIMNSTSSYFLNFYSNKAEIGLFMIGSMVAGVFNLGIWAFMQAWGPFALSISKQENAKTIYGQVLELYFVIGLFAACCLAFFSEEVLRIFTNPQYIGAKYVIGILAANIILQGIPQILSIANAVTRNNHSYSRAIIVGASVTLILYFLLVPMYGKEGAAISILGGNIVVPIVHGIQVQRAYPIPYNIFRVLKSGLLFAIIALSGLWVMSLSWSLGYLILIKLTFICACGLMLLFFYRRPLIALLNQSRKGQIR